MALYLKTAGGVWSAAGTWSATGAGGVDSAGPPTAATDCIAELLSGNLTIDGTSGSPSLCRSFDVTSGTGTWAGTLTDSATAVLTIGDATAGAGSVALKLHTGITFSPNAASTVNFISTSTTLQTIDFGGKTIGVTAFNGVAGKWAITTATTTAGAMTFSNGTLQMDGITDNSGLTHSILNFASSTATTRVLNLGNVTINLTLGGTAWNISNVTGITVNPGNSIINIGSGGSSSFTGGAGITYYDVRYVGGSTNTVGSSSTFTNLTATGPATKVGVFRLTNGSAITVTGTLTINGNSVTNRLQVINTAFGTANSITCTGATIVTNYTDWQDITFVRTTAGGLDLTNSGANLIGDCGGNSRTGGDGTVTFTTPQTQTSTGTASFTWSTHGWTTRVPLVQDDVVINNVFVSGRTITCDMPRAGKTIDMSGATWAGTAPTFLLSGSPISIFGGFAMASGMTYNGAGVGLFLSGRGSFFLTMNSVNFTTGGLNISMPGGTLTATTAWGISTGSFTHAIGTFNDGGFTITFGTGGYISNSGSTRTLNKSGLWTFATASGTVMTVVAAGLTMNDTGTWFLTDTGASSKTITGGGVTYNDLKIAGGGAGAIIISNVSMTFNRIYTDGLGTKSITLPGTGTTTLISGQGLNNGTNLITFTSSSGDATVSKSSGVLAWDYVSLTNIPSTGGATFYAGSHSVDGGGNTGWIFTDAPVPPGGIGKLMSMSISIGIP